MSDFLVWLREVRDDIRARGGVPYDIRARWLKALGWLVVVVLVFGGCVAMCSSYMEGYRQPDLRLGLPPGGQVIYYTPNGGSGGMTPTRIVDVGDACVTESWSYDHWKYESAQACKGAP